MAFTEKRKLQPRDNMAKITLAEIERIYIPRIEEHDKILVRGNGEPSLQEQMRGIQSYIKEDRENRKYYSRLFITVALTNIISLMIAAFVWFIKIYPVIEKLNIQKVSF